MVLFGSAIHYPPCPIARPIRSHRSMIRPERLVDPDRGGVTISAVLARLEWPRLPRTLDNDVTPLRYARHESFGRARDRHDGIHFTKRDPDASGLG